MPLIPGFDKTIKDWFSVRDWELPSGFIPGAAVYHDMIRERSGKMNIVSRNDLGILLERHILDSLVPLEKIPARGLLCDIGSGAGFPAIPIALARPELDIVMIESRRKKVSFLDAVIAKLELSRVSVREGRFEDFSPESEADIITIRAVALTEKIRKHSRKILKESGKLIYYNKFGSCRLI